MSEWISWFDHPVPDDVKGILIKYDDGIFSDRYDFETNKRKYREGHMILGWKFMERSNPSQKSIQCNQPERSKREDFSYQELARKFVKQSEECVDFNCGVYKFAEFLDEKMRCSEHDSNAVREVQ